MPKPTPSQARLTNWLLPAILVAVFLAVRMPALGRFVTTDEALWLRRSANFYLAVTKGDWAATYQSPHPGLITQWAGAAGFWLQFPQYWQVGFEEIHDFELLRLMENRGTNAMEVLASGRAVLVIIHAAAFAALWPFLRRLFGVGAAAFSMGLLALDPFLIAHQRLLHLDGLLASFMLLAILSYIHFVRTQARSALAVAGVATGLALLTKTPALFLLPAIAALAAYHVWAEWRLGTKDAIAWQGPLWCLAIALVVMFALFPALWTAPLDIFGSMVGYALGSAEGEYSGPVFFNGVIYPDGNLGAAGWYFYFINFLWRATPVVVFGLLAAAYGAFTSWREARQSTRLAVVSLALFAVGFGLFMTLADKKFDRYLLPALPPLTLLAGWGWWTLAARIAWLQKHAWRLGTAVAALVALQAASSLPTFPYYLSYYNPLLGGATAAPNTMMIGWGEGLDQAAAYLNAREVAAGDAAAWYSVSFNLMLSDSADDIPVTLELSPAELDSLLAKEYLVVYIHQWQRGTPHNLLSALKGLEPEQRVWINGLEYVRIYRLHER